MDLVIEIGPHGALAGPIRQTCAVPDFKNANIACTTCLVRNQNIVESAQKMAAVCYLKDTASIRMLTIFPLFGLTSRSFTIFHPTLGTIPPFIDIHLVHLANSEPEFVVMVLDQGTVLVNNYRELAAITAYESGVNRKLMQDAISDLPCSSPPSIHASAHPFFLSSEDEAGDNA